MSLESGRNQSGTWDQFAVNERLFGLKTDYDENIYTTTIDRSHPDYQKRLAEADRKAREIENSDSVNRHVLEERIRDHLTIDDSGLDEEDK
jgi:PAB1-binding protein PBP1